MNLLEFYNCIPFLDHPASSAVPINNRKLFNEIASLVDLPDDGRLFSETQPVVHCLIKAWQAEAGELFSWEAVGELYNSVHISSDSENTWGVRETNPIFSFLMYSVRLESSELSIQYKALAPFLLRRIRQCYYQMEDASDSYIYHLSLVARKLIISAPTLSTVSRFDWSYEIKLSFTVCALQKKLDDTIDLTTTSDWLYISDLLFRDRKKRGQGGGGHAGKRQQRWLLFERGAGAILHQSTHEFEPSLDVDSDQGCFLPNGRGKVNRITRIHPEVDLAEIASVGEHEVDYIHRHDMTFPASWFADPWKAKIKMRGKQEAMLANDRVLPWDKRCISLRTIITLINQLKRSANEPWLGLLAASLLLGLSEQSLNNLRVGILAKDGDPDPEVTEKLMQGCRYFDANRRIFWWLNLRGAEDGSNYLNVPLIVQLKLPRIFTKHLIEEDNQQGKLFRKSAFSQVKKYLRQLGNDGLGPPTLKRLQYTFEAYFVHGGGIPEIVADHLQGKIRNHLISQHYYITIPWQSAVSSWRSMVGVLLKSTEISVSILLRKMAYNYAQKDNNNQIFTGAVKTPMYESLRKHAALLQKSFPSKIDDMSSCSAAQWNGYVSYLYLLMSSCTGRRPQRDPFPLLSDFDLVSGCLFINDKWNKKYKESRVIPICNTLHKAMNAHSHLHGRSFMRWKLKGYSSSVCVGQLFLVDQYENDLVAVTPNALDRLSDFSNEKDYFEGLGNGCRHFLLTQMHQAYVPQEMIDFISGHRHVAREPEVSVSLVRWAGYAQIFRDMVENKIINRLSLREPFIDV